MQKFFVLLLITAFIACTKNNTPIPQAPKEPILPATLYNYAQPNLPAHFLDPALADTDNTPVDNPTTDAGATLGRVLFYDKALSKNNTKSCASCHVQSKGFSDPFILSEGFEGHFTGRHSMGLLNARYYPNGKFFWDERAATLEDQVLLPIQDSVEMGLTLAELITKLENKSYYEPLFVNAFGSTEVTAERVSKALAQFVRSLVSYQSKFDEGRALANHTQEPFPNFSASENRGKDLFSGTSGFRCSLCHGRDAQIANSGRNNGLDAVVIDKGIGGATGNPAEYGKFKVPSLRNVMQRAPYMHDGRFATIEEVLEHYSTGIKDHPTLEHNLVDNSTGGPKKFNMTVQQKQDLIAFFHTLTDSVITVDPKFSDPFQ